MTNDFKNFLLEHAAMFQNQTLDRNTLFQLYQDANLSLTAELTVLLMDLDIDVISTLGYIPRNYLRGNQTIKSLTIPTGDIISARAFQYSAVEEIALPNSLELIGTDAFYASKLKSVIVPPNVKEIGTGCFSYCSQLTYVNLGNIHSLGDEAFTDCHALKHIVIPQQLNYLSINDFENCYSLEEITYKGTKDQWEELVGSEKFNWADTDVVITCTDGVWELFR